MLNNVGGDLRGETTNGGVTVDVAGDHWDGTGLDVADAQRRDQAQSAPGFSAELEAGTIHGGFTVDFPVTVEGTHRLAPDATLGSGGPKLRAMTTNGGVTIRER